MQFFGGVVFFCVYLDFARAKSIMTAVRTAESERRAEVISVPPDVHAFSSVLQKKQLQNGSSAYLRTIVENLYRVYYNDFKYL